MSISAMKRALEALDIIKASCSEGRVAHAENEAAIAEYILRQAIAEAEKPEAVAIGDEWKPCVKLPIVVHVREQRKGETHVSTREGITPVKEDDLIMRGVAGEEYPIGRELFNRTYTFDTAPVHASDMSEKRVQISDKNRHEWGSVTDDALIEEVRRRGFTIRYAQISPKRWVGLTDEEIVDLACSVDSYKGLCQTIEATLKEKNT